MLDMLPHNALGQGHPMPMIEVGQPADRADLHTRALWHQLIISEHAYVRDLDRLQVSAAFLYLIQHTHHICGGQAYADAIKQHTSPTVVERMFPALNQLVNFQRWFCIHIETIASLPKEDQRLGMLFVDNVRCPIFSGAHLTRPQGSRLCSNLRAILRKCGQHSRHHSG
jgi:hypothetical protein